jgi:calcineurin-like phosphoesterase family protein
VVLSWQPGGTSLDDRYQVFRDGRLVAETMETKYVDSWLFEHTRYSYVVRAIDAAGQAADSLPLEVQTPAFEGGLELDPYLQQLTSQSVTIVWQTFTPAATSLDFGRADEPLVNVSRDPRIDRGHTVTVSGLAPDTLYSYRWESGGRLGTIRQFRTLPATVSAFSFGVIGDFGIATPAARANLQRLASDRIDFAITTGDNAQVFGTEQEYRENVLRPLAALISSRPFWPSIGNHDYYGLANYLRYFALPKPERYYSFTYGGVLFLSLDSNRYDAGQKSWARAELARSTAACKIAYFHHPLWSSGRGYRNVVRHRRREKIARILERGEVDLVFNGHVQNYERSKPISRGRVNRRRGIVYVVTGGGGAKLTPFVTRRRPRWSARRGSFYHRLRISFANNQLRGKAIDIGGNVRDRFRIHCQ